MTRHRDWGRGHSNWELKWCPLPHSIFNLFSKVTGFLLEPTIFSGNNHLHLLYWEILTRGSHVQNILWRSPLGNVGFMAFQMVGNSIQPVWVRNADLSARRTWWFSYFDGHHHHLFVYMLLEQIQSTINSKKFKRVPAHKAFRVPAQNPGSGAASSSPSDGDWLVPREAP